MMIAVSLGIRTNVWFLVMLLDAVGNGESLYGLVVRIGHGQWVGGEMGGSGWKRRLMFVAFYGGNERILFYFLYGVPLDERPSRMICAPFIDSSFSEAGVGQGLSAQDLFHFWFPVPLNLHACQTLETCRKRSTVPWAFRSTRVRRERTVRSRSYTSTKIENIART